MRESFHCALSVRHPLNKYCHSDQVRRPSSLELCHLFYANLEARAANLGGYVLAIRQRARSMRFGPHFGWDEKYGMFIRQLEDNAIVSVRGWGAAVSGCLGRGETRCLIWIVFVPEGGDRDWI